MRGKPKIIDLKTIKPKIYVNRKMISKLNLEKENLASKNKIVNNVIDNNCSTALQEQLQNIAKQMQEFSKEIKELKTEMRSDGKTKEKQLKELKDELKSDGKMMMDERLRRIETQVKATENKVGKNDNLMTDGN